MQKGRCFQYSSTNGVFRGKYIKILAIKAIDYLNHTKTYNENGRSYFFIELGFWFAIQCPATLA